MFHSRHFNFITLKQANQNHALNATLFFYATHPKHNQEKLRKFKKNTLEKSKSKEKEKAKRNEETLQFYWQFKSLLDDIKIKFYFLMIFSCYCGFSF